MPAIALSVRYARCGWGRGESRRARLHSRASIQGAAACDPNVGRPHLQQHQQTTPNVVSSDQVGDAGDGQRRAGENGADENAQRHSDQGALRH